MRVTESGQKVIWIIVLLLGAHFGKGQSPEEQFNTMMQKSSTYEQYKVIKITDINEFWQNIDSTLKSKNASIDRLQQNLKSQKTSLDTLKLELERTRSALEASEATNSSISFMGTDLNKSTYHLIVWLIIILLAAAVVVVYLMFLNSNLVTSKMKKDYSQLNNEFEEHKDKSREIQVKLKRELQTSVNTIEEMKRGGSSRR